MKKIIFQGLISITLFFATWFVFAQIDWVKIFKVQNLTDKTEEKLGEVFWEMFQKTEKESKTPFVINAVDSIVTKICISNNIDRKSITIHVLEKDEINAFALPNGHLIIYTGLILHSENQEQLCGVICHEMAHIQLNHVMKKLIKETGLSVLISMTTGKGGSDIIKETAKILSSTAFDRNIEKEADIKAVDYLIKANINPMPFADFLYNLSNTENEATKYLTWISTHPDSKTRATYIIEYIANKKITYKKIVSNITWEKLKEKLKQI